MRIRAGRLAGAAAPLAGLVLLWAAAAFACTNLATITLSAAAARPGDTLTLVGTSFPVPRATSNVAPTPVELRWKSADGPLLATLVPDRAGTISATFTVPPSEPGNVVIMGFQRRAIPDPVDPDGPPRVVDEPGTPARATIRVLAPGEMAPSTKVGVNFAAGHEGMGTTALIVLMVAFGAVALSLFAGGVMAFLYQVRWRRPVPQRRRGDL